MDTPTVASFTQTDASGTPVRFTVSTDIVDHLQPARTFGRDELADPTAHGRFQRRVIALPDVRADVLSPMILTISSDDDLRLVRRTAGGSAPWEVTDLGATLATALGRAPTVRAVGACATTDDRIGIAVAVDDPAQSGGQAGSRVFVAYDLHSASTDWTRIGWIDCGSRPGVRVEGVRVVDDGDGTWTVVLAGSQGPNDTVYLLRSDDPGRLLAHALVFSPASTLQELLDFEAGVHPTFGSGLYVLGTSGGQPSLAFRPFPTFGPSGTATSIPPVVLLPVTGGTTVLETGPTTPDGTDLFLGGEGIQLITGAAQDDAKRAAVTTVAGPDAVSRTVDLALGPAAEGTESVWALQADGVLTVVSRAPGAGGWGTPLRLRTGVQEMAPVGGDAHQSASVLVVYGDGHAAHLWRDGRTGAWQEAPIPVADPEQVSAVQAYGTSLRVVDESGVPRPGVMVRASASALASVTVNGSAAYLGPGVEVTATTDANGSVTIYDPVRSLTPAVYRFAVQATGQVLDVNPAAGVHGRFLTVTADDLRGAQVTAVDGTRTPLLTDAFTTGADRGQVDAVAGALNQGARLAASTDGPVPGVSVVGGTAGASVPAAPTATLAASTPAGAPPFSSTLRPDALPADYRWGVQSDGGGVRMLDGDALSALVGAAADAERFFVGLGDTIADFFEGLAHRLEEEVSVALHRVQDAFEFVCELGGKVRRWLVRTLEEVGAFFTWLWGRIEVGLEELWGWLKFVFDWSDVLRVRDTMVQVTDQALQYLQSSVSGVRSQVSAGCDAAVAEIERWRGLASPVAGVPTPPPPDRDLQSQLKAGLAGVEDLIDKATGHSVVSWVMQRLEGLISEAIQFEGASPADDLIQAAVDFATGLVSDEVNNLIATVERVQGDLVRLFGGRMPAPQELSFETVRDAVVAVGADAFEGLLTGLRDLVLRALDLVVSLIGALRDALFLRIRFPFVEKLAALVAPGTHVDASFRFVDALMLLAAVPATIAYKVFFDDVPVRPDDVITLPFGRVTVQSVADLDAVTRFSWIGGLVGAFVKLGLAAKSEYAAAQAYLSGQPPPPPPAMWMQGIGTLFAGVGVAAEVGSRHGDRGEAVSVIEWYMVGISSFSVVKSIAVLLAEVKAKEVNPALLKVQAGLDLACYIAHFGLRTAEFSLMIEADREDHAPEGAQVSQDELLLSLGWMEALFDHAGSFLIAAAVLDEDPESRSIVLGVGAGTKAIAFISDLVFVLASGKVQRALVV